MKVEEKILLNRYCLGRERPHITVKTETCRECALKPCLYVCPVENYKLEGTEVRFSCESCLECGACRLACGPGAVDWSYPLGGLGVCFRYG